ncbi:NAD(P)H-binding protein [Pediococcus inopinatus]|uniref:NAD(P)H-binding protein n=1 Tax=Pediococcus inopinatus TaxID=114090 RepID=A0ABZ0Q3D9_9LACO|nr:NAD(P)H-binding protein [Pediococcus inopinatus]WPC19137.1 NAD(P)H-binding protein [Pediococcus inopinatus]WPC20929.1 NAD(P)H-binding protein [Pediococcus inopinatus]
MKVIILGATGQISGFLIERLLRETDAELTLFGHNVTNRVQLSVPERENIVDGDILDIATLVHALKGQDIVFLNVPTADAMNGTATAMQQASIRRLIVSGTIGLYDEVGGKFGEWGKSSMGAYFSNRQPERNAIDALDSDSNIDYTYVRMSMLYNNSKNDDYTLIPFGEMVTGAQVSRQAVARFITDMVKTPTLQINKNVAIIEKGSENMSKPSFY